MIILHLYRMATDRHVSIVEQIISYTFETKDHLVIALTAADVDEQNHDGNRRLAQVGEDFFDFRMVGYAFDAQATRGNYLRKEILSPLAYAFKLSRVSSRHTSAARRIVRRQCRVRT